MAERSDCSNYTITKFLNYSISSRFLQLDQKALELGSECVGIHNRRRKPVQDRPRVLVFVFLNAAVALMNRNADLVDLLAVNRHRLDAFGHERLGDVKAPRTGDLHSVVALDAQL